MSKYPYSLYSLVRVSMFDLYSSLLWVDSSDDIAEKYDESNAKTVSVVNQRSNNTVYVCWHRNTSISIDDHLKAVEVNY